MRESSKPLDDLMKQLPPELQEEVRDFAEFLLQRIEHKGGQPLHQDWAGALKDYRHLYTSLDLQKKALEWRGD